MHWNYFDETIFSQSENDLKRMADTFLGTRADIPVLGAGMLELDNDLIKAPEEEDIDMMNDETFGDNIDADFDWEEAHEKLAELEEDPGKNFANKTRDSGYYPTDRSYRSQEEYMEQSISQLVVDDDEIEDDPAILNVSKGQPIPKRAQDLDELFGPASPPGFLDTEHLVSPTSRNIWGSPVRETQAPPKTINNIQTLFEFVKNSKQTPQPNVRQVKTVEELEQQLMHKPANTPKVMTAEDLERQLRGESGGDQRVPQLPPHDVRSPYHPVGMPPQHLVGSPAPRFPQTPQSQRVPPGYSPLSHKMVNDHRSPAAGYGSTPPTHHQLINGRRSPLTDPHHSFQSGHMAMDGRRSPLTGLPNNTPPMSSLLEGRKSPLMNISDVLQAKRLSDGRISPVLMMGSAPPGGRISPVVMLQRRSPLTSGMSPINRTPSPPPINFSSPQFAVSPLTQARMMSPYGRGMPPPLNMMGNRMATPPIGIPRGMQRGNNQSSPFNSPNGPLHSPYNSPSAGPRMATPGRNDPRRGGGRGHNRIINQNNRNDSRPYNNNFNKRRYYQFNEEAHQRQTVDEYAGLMTQREKDWIIKIQLLQLQTDNPYLDDYYYTTFTLKKKARERYKQQENGVNETGDNNPELVIPAMAKLETKEYRPAQFEGSLGRLTTSSVHNPRQIIDIKSKGLPADESDTKGVSKELRKSRQLLMEIEKGYDLLLDIDDIEKRTLALPEESRIPLFEDRKQMLLCLYRYMLCEDHAEYFLSIMSIKKGRKLVARVLPLLEKAHAENVVVLLLKNLQSLIKKDQGDEGLVLLYDVVSRIIDNCDLETLVRFSEELQHECPQSQSKTVAIAIQNKFGSSVICSLLHRGEIIYTTSSPLDLDSQHQTTWCQFVHDFAGILATVPTESLIHPIRTYKSISEHFERLLNRKLAAIIEDKVVLFTDIEVGSSGDMK